MSNIEIDTVWRAAFGATPARPNLYSSDELNEEGWLPITDPQAFILNIKTLNQQQMYAASSNNQIAMKSAQDEFLDIERKIADIKGRNTIKNPQALPESDIFEDRKESALYGYKYDGSPALLNTGNADSRPVEDITEQEKNDVRILQDPFKQGGFVPTEANMTKALSSKNNRNPRNLDGWEPIIDKAGRRLIPRQQLRHDEYNIIYVKRKVDSNGEVIRPTSEDGSDVEAAVETPDKAVDKRLTRTRFDGKKIPPTREASEEPSGISTPRGRKRASPSGQTSRDDTPNSKRQKISLTVKGQDPTKPKHPNQYTKAKERAAKELAEAGLIPSIENPQAPAPRPRIAAANTSTPAAGSRTWRDMSPTSKYNHSWTNAELHEAIREGHEWLHDDPATAEQWKNKLLANVNPIRSFAMYKKWRFWKSNNLDKRPRNKNAAAGSGAPARDTGDANPLPPKMAKPKLALSKAKTAGGSGSGTSTPAITPAISPGVTPAPEVLQVNSVITVAPAAASNGTPPRRSMRKRRASG